MIAWKTLIVAMTIGLLGGSATSGSAAPPPVVDIRGEDGKILIAADQIQSYDWTTHTLTLAPKVRAGLVDRLMETRRPVSGVPFAVTVDGKTLYRGNFTSGFSSRSFDTPVIVVGPEVEEEKLGPDQFRIALGYPSPQFFKGTDPRPDARLRKALRAARKLANVQPVPTP